ncbi:MAG: diiron oxygenase [Burkholderiales bacterium]|nr:diiron oxygenase [Burkholderiales bacterium]
MLQINQYQNKWESRSSVRTRARKEIDFRLGGNLFPAHQQILLMVPEIEEMGSSIHELILVQSLYKYLNDIVTLEIKCINSACNKLIYENLIVNYDDETKLNAYTIIIDEYYHVYVAKDMLMQIQKQFPSIKQLAYPISDSFNAVKKIQERLEQKYHAIFEIIAVCIFETTIVKELVEFFNTPDVHPSLKYYVNDHMNDEAKHYGFFYNLLCHTWSKLPDEYIKHIGIHLADFVKLYLNISSEKSYNLLILKSILKNDTKAESIITKMYSGFAITTDIPMVKNVLNVLKKSGIMDNKLIKDSFIANGLYI